MAVLGEVASAVPWNIDDLRVFLRTDDLTIYEEIPFIKLSIELTARRTDVWQITTLPIKRVRDRLTPSTGVVIKLGDKTVLEGFVDVVGPYQWDAESNKTVLSFNGASDVTLLADTIAWPEPTVATGGRRLADKKMIKEGAAETIALDFISENVGTTRDANRTISGLRTPWLVSVPSTQGRGSSRKVSARYDPLMDVVRECFDGTDLDVDVKPNANRDGFDLEIVQYRDLTNTTLKFSKNNQNLRRVEWQDSIPDFNSMILALETYTVEVEDPENAGEMMEIRERRIRGRHLSEKNYLDWGDRQRETFFDPGDLRELDANGDPVGGDDGVQAATDYADSELTKAQGESWVKAQLASTHQSIFMTDFFIGDLVNIEIEPGLTFSERISTVKIEADTNTGRLDVVPMTGILGEDPSETVQERRIRRLADFAMRLRGR